MACCCKSAGALSGVKTNLPLICLVPRDDARPGSASAGGAGHKSGPPSGGFSARDSFKLLDDAYIKKNFKLAPRALYLDPFRRPLITFPMSQEGSTGNFNMARKYKINQQILDGLLDPSEAIMGPSVFPYAQAESEKQKHIKEDEEIIYILQLPDYEYTCPVHNQTIRTPRFIWHSCKPTKDKKGKGMKQGAGPMNKPKPWLLSRHTDFDLLSQW